MIQTLKPIVTANDMFDELTPEEEISQRKLKLTNERNENLEKIVEGYERFSEITSSLDIGAAKIDEKGEDDPFCTLASILIPKQYTSKDITEFTLRHSKEFDTLDGYYLSALFNKSPEKRFKIFLENPISYVGWENRGKEIMVIGDVNDFLGAGMRKGKIIVQGSVRDYCGEHMRAGEIVIAQNAGNYLGRTMYGGRIEVSGNVENSAGAEMVNGIIIIRGNAGHRIGDYDPTLTFKGEKPENGIMYLEGNYKSLGDYIKCKEIWHQGKLIVRDGEVLE